MIKLLLVLLFAIELSARGRSIDGHSGYSTARRLIEQGYTFNTCMGITKSKDCEVDIGKVNSG